MVLHLLSCRHAGASVDIADGQAVLLLLMNHAHEVPKVAIVLDDFVEEQSAWACCGATIARSSIP